MKVFPQQRPGWEMIPSGKTLGQVPFRAHVEPIRACPAWEPYPRVRQYMEYQVPHTPARRVSHFPRLWTLDEGLVPHPTIATGNS